MKAFFLTLLAGIAVLAIWRYCEKALQRVDSIVAKVFPRVAFIAVGEVKQYGEAIAEILGFRTGACMGILIAAVIRGSVPLWLGPATAGSLAVWLLVARKSAVLFASLVFAYWIGLAIWYGVQGDLWVSLELGIVAPVVPALTFLPREILDSRLSFLGSILKKLSLILGTQ